MPNPNYLAVQCLTEADALRVLQKFETLGYQWAHGYKPTEWNPIETGCVSNCLTVSYKMVQQSDIHYCREVNFTIVSSQEYLC